VQLVEAHGGTSTVLTLGPPEAEEQLRYAASVGIARAVLVPATGDVDPQRTAASITAAVAVLEARDGPFDIVLFGNESADAGGFQVGVRVATALGRPMVNGAKGLIVDGATVVVERPTDSGLERYVLPLPAVVGVKEGINLPRYPTLKGRLASKKIAVETIDASAPDGGLAMMRLRTPTEQAAAVTVVLGHGPDAAPAVVDLLTELALL
jgi:electron transfer flavoprotein beta subunit